MKVCKQCLAAIWSHEGDFPYMHIWVDDPEDEAESTCEWCEESGFEELYEI